MKRYSPNEKSDALKMVEASGVAKTSTALGISTATLFKWKREAEGKAPPQPKTKKTAVKKAPVKKEPSKKAAVEAARTLLQDDDTAEKIRQLEAENVHLRDTNAKLRKALAALLD